jgi:hypothetical protein
LRVVAAFCTVACIRLRDRRDLVDGLSNWMDAKGFATSRRARLSLPRVSDWGDLNLNYKVARRSSGEVIGCLSATSRARPARTSRSRSSPASGPE